MEAIFILMAILTPIITGMTELVKKYIGPKYYPIAPVVVGLILAPLCLGLPFITANLSQLVFAGLLSGLSAGGFYSIQGMRNK